MAAVSAGACASAGRWAAATAVAVRRAPRRRMAMFLVARDSPNAAPTAPMRPSNCDGFACGGDESASRQGGAGSRRPMGFVDSGVTTPGFHPGSSLPIRRDAGSYSRRDWAIAIGVWSALAALSMLQTALYLEQHGQPIEWRSLIIGRALDWYTCLALAPVFVWLIQRYAIAPGRRARGAALIVLAAAAFVPIKYAALVPLTRALAPPAPRTVRTAVVANFFTEMLFLLGI